MDNVRRLSTCFTILEDRLIRQFHTLVRVFLMAVRKPAVESFH